MYIKNSLQNNIIFSFITVTLIFIAVIVSTMLSGWVKSLDNLIICREKETAKEITDRVEAFMNIPLTVNAGNWSNIKYEVVDIYDQKQRDPFFVSVLKTAPGEIYGFSYGTETGEYYGARRNEENQIEIIRNDATTNGHSHYFQITPGLNAGQFVNDFGGFDPRIRDWYRIAQDKRTPSFSPIYKHFAVKDLALTAAHPVYNQAGTLLGVMGTHFTLSQINTYLQEITKDRKITAYIVEKNSGQLVANSLNQPNFIPLATGGITGLTVEQIGNDYIANAYRNYKINKVGQSTVKTADDRLHIKITEYNNTGINWLIITLTPESQFTGQVKTTIWHTMLITMTLSVLVIVCWVKRVKYLLKPINALKEVTNRVASGDLSCRAKIYRSDEIGELSIAFNKMAGDLHTLIGRLSKSFNMNPNIIMLVSLQNNTYIAVNNAFLNASGLLQEEILGRSIVEYCLWDDPKSKAEITKAMLSDGYVSGYEIQYYSCEGVRTGLLSCDKDIIDDKPCVLITITDITAKKQFEAELTRFDSLNLIGEMAAGIGHEVRNPMTTIRGYLQLLQDKQELARYHGHFKLMIDELDRANNIITEFLSLAKNKKVEMKCGNLNEVIQSLFPLLQADALRRGHEIILDIHEISNFAFDEKEIRQLILNFVRNGFEALANRGKVIVRTYERTGSIILTVQDTGTGIPEEVIKKLGIPFVTTKENGTGLGLPVCYRIAERHGASIKVDTGPQGTSFMVVFPKLDKHLL
ncbi:ATP-binding protein [Sporomusa aerivorans]|uniref:ATP-binding protein n=1 Tax=Sporomusa aerivorans TaxID=204936 RepID=UPI00352A5087